MRVQQLDKFVSMLNEMEILIRFRAMRSNEIIKEISCQDSFSNFIFLNILNEYTADENYDINACWQKSVSKTAFLTDSDKWIFSNVGEQIGVTDIDGQISMLKMNKNLAEKNLMEAREDLKVKGKMFRTVWGLLGIAASIMII